MELKYELRKTFLRRYVIALIVTLLLINVGIIIYGYYHGSGWLSDGITRPSVSSEEWKYYSALMDKTKGRMTAGKASYIMRLYSNSEHSGYKYAILSTCFYKPYKYMASYAGKNQKIVDRASEDRYIKSHYVGRQLDTFFDTIGWKKLFSYDYSDIFIIAMLLLTIIPCIKIEEKSGMRDILLSSSGRFRSYFLEKNLMAVCVSVILVATFSIENFLVYSLTYGLKYMRCPVYSIEDYKYCPLDVSLIGFYLITVALRILGFISFSQILVFLCRRIKNVYSLLISALAMVVIFIYMRGFWNCIDQRYNAFVVASPFSGLVAVDIFKALKGIYVGEYYIPLTSMYLIVQIVIMVSMGLCDSIPGLLAYFGERKCSQKNRRSFL